MIREFLLTVFATACGIILLMVLLAVVLWIHDKIKGPKL